jgi:hypothetical protein
VREKNKRKNAIFSHHRKKKKKKDFCSVVGVRVAACGVRGDQCGARERRQDVQTYHFEKAGFCRQEGKKFVR